MIRFLVRTGVMLAANAVDLQTFVFVLVRPQMGENIGAVARVMLNFGLVSLRLVNPRDRWPNPKADIVAVGAEPVLAKVRVEWRLQKN